MGAGTPPRRALRLALAGGGTGGHLLPGRHLLAHLLRRGELELAGLVWFTSGRAVEERALEGLGDELGSVPFERVVLPIEPPGGGAPSRPRLALRTPGAARTARAALRRAGSEVLLGLGGFTSLPAVLAARSLGLGVALLEVNATAGAATRVLGPLAGAVLHAFRTGVPAGRGRHLHVGPILPPSLGAGATRADYSSHLARSANLRGALGLDPSRPLLLVLGGSQGAGSLNAFLRVEAPSLCARGVQIVHQTGPGRLGEGCGELPGYRALEFSADVPRLLGAATLVLCRAGASTLLELAAAGAPAVVVPYPHAADGHQDHNARELGDGVRVVRDADLGPATAAELLRLLGPEGAQERARMHAALIGAVPRDGAERTLEVLSALARPRPR